MWSDKYKGERFIHQDSDEFEDGMQNSLEVVSAFYNNDEYLNNQTEELQDSTSPVTRKRFSPVVCNQNKSFSVIREGDNYVMDERTELKPLIRISPSHTTFIDYNRTTVKPDKDHKFAPPYTPAKRKNLNTATRTYFNKKGRHGHINEYWYIAYEKGKPYKIKKEWLSHDDRKMSAVCRGQTFVPKVNGYLEELSLKLKSPKHPTYPLIVEIVKTDKNNNPYGMGTIKKWQKEDDPSKHLLLARTTLKSHGTSASLRTVRFNKPAYVKKGEYYAIVLRSPFTRASDPYWIGGWTKWCKQSRQKGGAYTSTDNGWHWKKHGKLEKTSRNQGRWAPTNFYYICGIRPLADKPQPKEGTYYLYTKPMKFNPIKSVQIYATKSANVYFEILDNVHREWQRLTDEKIVYSNRLPNQFMIRAVFDYTKQSNNIPTLDYFDIAVDMEKPHDAILRTSPYVPRLEGLLGASIYGKINAPYLVNDKKKDISGVSVKVDIVRETPYIEYIEVISFKDIKEYDEVNIVEKLLSDKGIEERIENIFNITEHAKYIEEVNILLEQYPDLRKELSDESIYIAEDNRFKSIHLEHKPSYPLMHISYQPYFDEDEDYDEYEDLVDRIKEDQDTLDLYDAGILTYKPEAHDELTKRINDLDAEIEKQIKKLQGKEQREGFDLTEFVDYSVNYETNEITPVNDILQDVKANPGYFLVEYNPCFIKGLTNQDFPLRVDLFKEEFNVPNIRNNEFVFKLKVPALDPLRKVCTNMNMNNEIVLVEDEDFTVDYANQMVKVHSSKIKAGDKITVKYTPYFVDDAISILYRIHRDDVRDKIKILPNYIEYKT